MTDFNLEQFKAGRIAITEAGQEARYIGEAIFLEDEILKESYIFAIREEKGFDTVRAIDKDGKCVFLPVRLVQMKPEKKKLYIAVCSNIVGNSHSTSNAYLTKEEAARRVKMEETEIYRIVEVEIEV